MTLFVKPAEDSLDLEGLSLVFDLDGVLVDVRSSYRQCYVDAINYYLHNHGGCAVDGEGVFTLDDVHVLKTHKDFNAPHTVVDFLVKIGLVMAQKNPGETLNRTNSGIGDWIREGLVDSRLDHWEDALWAELDGDQKARALERFDLDHALALCHESYVGSDLVESVYGHPAERQIPGLSDRDIFKLDRNRPAPSCPLGIYTGRVYGETRHLINQFAFFQGIQDQHICTIDRGYRKPEADALEYLVDALGASSLIYFGDLPADRSAALAFRAKRPNTKLWLAQILETEETAYWPEANFVSSEPGSVLDWLGV